MRTCKDPIKNGRKLCLNCKEEKLLSEFSILKSTITGYEYKCRKCVSEYGKEYRKRRPEMYEKAKERHRNFMKEYTKIAWQKDKKNPNRIMERKRDLIKWKATLKGRFVCWRKSAKKRQISWDLSFEDIKDIPLTCHYTGETLSLEAHLYNTISLDRIDNSKGYTKDNVVFCGKLVNNMKNTQTKSNFIKMCRMVSNNFKDTEDREDKQSNKKGAVRPARPGERAGEAAPALQPERPHPGPVGVKMKKIGIALFVCAFLTALCGIWWVQSENDFVRYFLQTLLFVFTGGMILTIAEEQK